MKNTKLIIIGGATASGKTALAIELAKILPIEIISSDSRQLFKFLTIGTAKPSAEELAVCPHHLIDILMPDEYYSAGMFAEDAKRLVEEITNRGKIPVIVGGSGLYIKALCDGFFEEDSTNENYTSIRNQLETKLNEIGRDALFEELAKIDPISARKYSDKNPRRIIRALECYYSNGKLLSEAQMMQSESNDFECIYFAIDLPRNELYNKINYRTEIMWNNGLVDETRFVLNNGYFNDINALNTVGYKETIEFINGNITEIKAVELIKQNTRRYAKRQLTWFRNQVRDMIWLKGDLVELAVTINRIYHIN